jgi:hypothetical protein
MTGIRLPLPLPERNEGSACIGVSWEHEGRYRQRCGCRLRGDHAPRGTEMLAKPAREAFPPVFVTRSEARGCCTLDPIVP